MTGEQVYEVHAFASITFDEWEMKPPWSALSWAERDKWEAVAHELTLADREGAPDA